MKKNEVIKKYKRKETIDIEKLYQDFYYYVYTIITNLARGQIKEEDIEEVIVDTFFVLWKNQNKLEEDKKIKPYIAGITKKLTQEKIRKNRRHEKIIDYENKIENIQSIDFVEEEREEIADLKEIVKHFKEQDQQIFESYYYQGKKIKEIAKDLKQTEFTVKQRLYRIRKRMKEEIKKKEGGYQHEK